MIRFLLVGLTVLLALAGFYTPNVQAQQELPGGKIISKFPPQGTPVQPQPQVVPQPKGTPLPQPKIVQPAPVKITPVTIFDFVRSFKPQPGNYEVCFVHPYTGRPVTLRWSLPPGCTRVVLRRKLFCYEIDFEYGSREIELNFSHRGRVRVDFN